MPISVSPIDDQRNAVRIGDLRVAITTGLSVAQASAALHADPNFETRHLSPKYVDPKAVRLFPAAGLFSPVLLDDRDVMLPYVHEVRVISQTPNPAPSGTAHRTRTAEGSRPGAARPPFASQYPARASRRDRSAPVA